MSDSDLYNVSTDVSTDVSNDVNWNVNYHPVDLIDKSAYITGLAVLVSLIILLNLAVIAFVLYLHVKRREVAARSPQYIPMAACSVTQLGLAVWYSVTFLHELRLLPLGGVFSFNCSEMLAVDMSVCMMYTLVMLLVAAVIVAEAVRLQTLVALTWIVRKVLAAVLVVLAVLYVLVVIVPVFMTTQLADPSQPCIRDTNIVNYVWDEKSRRILPALNYIVPALFILLACLTLILAYCTRRSASSFTRPNAGYVVSYSVPASATATPAGHGNDEEKGPVDPSITFNNPHHGQPLESSSDVALPVGAGTGVAQPNNGKSPLIPGQGPPYPQVMPTPSNELQPSNQGFPFNVILAAVACIALQYFSFHHLFSGNYTKKLWVAGTMLDVLVHVFVPLFWLLDADIRALWCCCCRRGPGSAPMNAETTVPFLPQ